MNRSKRLLSAIFLAYMYCTASAHAKPIEDIFNEMLALRETDAPGFWAMICCIGLLFTLALGLMALTMGYYVRHWFKRK